MMSSSSLSSRILMFFPPKGPSYLILFSCLFDKVHGFEGINSTSLCYSFLTKKASSSESSWIKWSAFAGCYFNLFWLCNKFFVRAIFSESFSSSGSSWLSSPIFFFFLILSLSFANLDFFFSSFISGLSSASSSSSSFVYCAAPVIFITGVCIRP